MDGKDGDYKALVMAFYIDNYNINKTNKSNNTGSVMAVTLVVFITNCFHFSNRETIISLYVSLHLEVRLRI